MAQKCRGPDAGNLTSGRSKRLPPLVQRGGGATRHEKKKKGKVKCGVVAGRSIQYGNNPFTKTKSSVRDKKNVLLLKKEQVKKRTAQGSWTSSGLGTKARGQNRCALGRAKRRSSRQKGTNSCLGGAKEATEKAKQERLAKSWG